MTINLLPLDGSGHPIDLFRLSPGNAQQIAFTGTSARQTNAFVSNRLAIAVYATKDCFVKTGSNTVTATTSDHFLPAGFYTTLALKGDTYIAAISNGTNGTLYISELE